MLIVFITEVGKNVHIEHILGMGSFNTENYNKNDFYSYLQKIDLIYTY